MRNPLSIDWDNGPTLTLSQGDNPRFVLGIRLALCRPTFTRDNGGAMATAFGPLVLVYWPKPSQLCGAEIVREEM